MYQLQYQLVGRLLQRGLGRPIGTGLQQMDVRGLGRHDKARKGPPQAACLEL